jgi:hypothetical protein
MGSLDYFSVIDEIRMISSYLNFSYNNLVKFEETVINDLEESIQLYKSKRNFPPEFTTDQIIGQALIEEGRMAGLDEYPVDEAGRLSLRISHELYSMEVAGNYNTIFYATIVIMVCSIIERGIKSIFDLNDLRGIKKLIQKVQEILNGRPGQKIDDVVWKELEQIASLRNWIIHSGMVFQIDDFQTKLTRSSENETQPKFRLDLMDYLNTKALYTVVLKQHGIITLDYSYCQHLVEFTQNFFSQISSFALNSEG